MNHCLVNMSYMFVLSARESVLTAVINPPLVLDDQESYVLGFLNFVSFNTIPNIDEKNNKFYIGDITITIPDGSYEIQDIEYYIKKDLIDYVKRQQNPQATVPVISIKANLNTLRCEIKSMLDVDFTKPNSIARILGFNERILKANKKHISDNPINISRVNTICVDCNLVTNSYNNGKPVHILHTFSVEEAPGYKINISPPTTIYLPINTHYIDNIIVKITDEFGNLVNFNEELVTVTLHLKKLAPQ